MLGAPVLRLTWRVLNCEQALTNALTRPENELLVQENNFNDILLRLGLP